MYVLGVNPAFSGKWDGSMSQNNEGSSLKSFDANLAREITALNPVLTDIIKE
jgi:hypothetical protein